ncbi:hypothetical protein P154DRAFT_526754 [Amniculicola lignicola CBS 123094]|uniref:Uncharacterized protein n=1 Tax=Amniculicola lignicola CBS 123094 TaxID=1392246 RepID=A0A6A5WB50_9PLEO|nr:hypothetical protein P154DRAFT_526754 [Amniculicola lignicola CBS 123094]
MHSILHACRAAVPASKLIPRIANGSSRAFSRSSASLRGKSLPEFLEASTPALSAELAILNSQILLPLHLTHEQQQLVYKEKNRAALETDPVPITIGNVTLPLKHIDQNRMPNRWRTLKAIVDQSSTPEDWENVLRMMEGFRNAGVHVKGNRIEKIIRQMSEAGMHHLILKAAQRADKTDFKLDNPGIVYRAFGSMYDKAADSGWDLEETRKALSMSEQLLELMEDKEHLGKKEVGPHDLRASPLVIAVPTGLTAAIAKMFKDEDHFKVAKYASRLVDTLEQNNGEFLEITIPQMNNELKEKRNFFQNTPIFSLMILQRALKTSSKILGADMPKANVAKTVSDKLSELFKEIEENIDDSRQVLFRKHLEKYQKLEEV